MYEPALESFRSTGDGRALGEIFHDLAPALLAVASRRCPDRAQAEDMVQATFLRAIQRIAAFDPARSLRSWLLGILGNLIREERRRPAVRSAPEIDLHHGKTPLVEVEAREFLRELQRAVAELPEGYRVVVELRLWRRRRLDEIAEQLGCPVGTVKTRLHRGTAMLRRIMPRGLAPLLVAMIAGSAAIAASRGTHVPVVSPGRGTRTALGWTAASLVLLAAVTVPWTWTGTAAAATGAIAAASPALVTPPDAEPSPVVVRVPQYHVFRGVIVPTASGAVPGAVDGAWVVARDPAGPEVARAPVRADGAFELRSPIRRPSIVLDHPFFAFVRPVRPARDDLGALAVYRGGLITGQLEGPVPAAGAVVEAITEPDPLQGLRDPGSAMAQGLSEGVLSVPVRADGSFELRGVFPSPEVRVRTASGSFAAPVCAVTAGCVRRLRLRPVPMREVRVTVAGPEGLPVGDARIGVLPIDAVGDLNPGRRARTADADSAGCCVLSSLPRDEEFLVTVRRLALGGLALARVRLAPVQTGLRIVLPPGRELQGQVLDAEGRGVAGARVAILAPDQDPAPPRWVALEAAATSELRTDAHGRFAIAGLPPGVSPVLAVHHPEFAGYVGTLLDIRLQPGASLRGRITGASDRPLFVSVAARRGLLFSSTEPVVEQQIDGDRFSLAGLPAGRLVVRVGSAGSELHTEELRVRPGQEIDLGPIDLRAPALRRGIVVDPAGRAVAGARLIRCDRAEVLPVFADGGGEFAAEPGARLVVSAPGFSPALVEMIGPQATGGRPVEARLGVGGRLRGRVVPAGGDRVEEFQVVVGPRRHPDLVQIVGCGPDGWFELADLPVGGCDVRVMNPGGLRRMERDMARYRHGLGDDKRWQGTLARHLRVVRVEVTAGRVTDVEVDLRPVAERTVPVTGAVSLGGEPLEYAVVEVRPASGGDRIVDGVVRDGLLEVPDLPPGSYRLNVVDPRSGEPMRPDHRLEVGDRPLRVELLLQPSGSGPGR